MLHSLPGEPWQKYVTCVVAAYKKTEEMPSQQQLELLSHLNLCFQKKNVAHLWRLDNTPGPTVASFDANVATRSIPEQTFKLPQTLVS